MIEKRRNEDMASFMQTRIPQILWKPKKKRDFEDVREYRGKR